MNQVAHQKIVDLVLKKIYIPDFYQEARKGLYIGSVTPDYNREFFLRSHHHNRKYIKNLIIEARKYFLNGYFYESGYYLGIAFHFIADMTCPDSNYEIHSDWEYTNTVLIWEKTGADLNVKPEFADSYRDIDSYINKACLQTEPLLSLHISISVSITLLAFTWRSPYVFNVRERDLIDKAKKEYEETQNGKAKEILEWYGVIKTKVEPMEETLEEKTTREYKEYLLWLCEVCELDQRQKQLMEELLNNAPIASENISVIDELESKCGGQHKAVTKFIAKNRTHDD